jgi:hypothetical protein
MCPFYCRALRVGLLILYLCLSITALPSEQEYFMAHHSQSDIELEVMLCQIALSLMLAAVCLGA